MSVEVREQLAIAGRFPFQLRTEIVLVKGDENEAILTSEMLV